jgi:hypothetical protein
MTIADEPTRYSPLVLKKNQNKQPAILPIIVRYQKLLVPISSSTALPIK